MRFPASRVALPVLAALCALAALGCSSTAEEPQAEVRTVVTVIREVPADDTPLVDETVDDAAPAEESRGEESAPSSSASGRIRVPNVVGQDHQLAQDTMQAEGLYSLAEEDATGQGRMLLFDRNWTVVSQSPAAGTRVSADATITLRSKKDGE